MKSTVEILRDVRERIEDARLAVRQALDMWDAGLSMESTVGTLHEAHECIEDVRLVVEQALERLDAR